MARVPGKPGFGTIVAAVEDGAGLFPQLPTLAGSQALPEAVLPGESFTAETRPRAPSLEVAKNCASVGAAPVINEHSS